MEEIFNVDAGIKDFIETNFPIFLDSKLEARKPEYYVLGYPNLSKYLSDIVCYVLPFRWEFRNEGNFITMTMPFEVYFTFKNQEDDITKTYLQYFFEFISENYTLGGIVDSCFFTAGEPFDGIEGSEDAKADKIDLIIKIIQ